MLFLFAVYEPDFQAAPVQNGLPGAQVGYMTTGNVQVNLCSLIITFEPPRGKTNNVVSEQV